MKIVIVSNDFRVYWKDRLIFLQSYLITRAIELQVVELFGKGSPYLFDSYQNNYKWWHCLFPDKSANELSKQDIKKAFFSILNNTNPDIVIASPITFFAGALGLQWAKKNKRKYIMFDDAKPLVQFKRNFFVQWVKNMLTSQADALWLPDHQYDSAYPALANKNIHFFYGFSCVNNNLFKPPGKKRLDNQVLICVARLVPVKNITNLLKAWQIIEQHRPGQQLNIIGDGPDYDALLQLSHALNLKYVSFLSAVANNKLPAYYHNADAFILPSLSETWGLVVNEAMAAGLPVLLSNKINAAQSLLYEGINGFGFAPENVTEITDTIIKYIDTSITEREDMSAQSLKIIAQMDYEQMALQLLNALPLINGRIFKKPGALAQAIINLWYGKHDTSAWDSL